MRIVSKILAVGLAAMVVFGCEPKKDIAEAELTSYIPADAKAVISVNLNSLKTKAGSLDKVFEGTAQPEDLKQIFESAAHAYFTVKQEDNGSIELLSLAKLADVAPLKKHLGDVVKTVAGVDIYALTHTVENITTTTVDLAEDTELKVVETEETYGYAGLKDNMMMTLTSPNMKSIDESVIEKLAASFTKPTTSLLATEATFEEVLAKNKDFAIWMSGSFETNEKTVSMLPAQYKGLVENLNLEGSYSSATLDFENGAVIADYFFQGNDEYKEKFQKVAKEGLEASTANQYKIQETTLLISTAFDPKELLKAVKEAGAEKEVDGVITESGLELSSSDFVNMINGDILLSVGKVDIMTQDAELEVLIGVTDEEKVKTTLDLLAAQDIIQQEEDVYSKTIGMVKVLISVNEGVLIITKDNTFGQALVNGEGEVNSEVADKLTTSTTMMYINPSNIPYQMFVSPDQAAKLDQIESLEFIGKKGDDATGTGVLEVKLKDKNQNALALINEAIYQ